MSTKTIEIAGEDWPVRMSLGAMNKFDNKFKKENVTSLNVFQSAGLRVEHFGYLMLYFIQAGLKHEGDDRKIDIEWIFDNVEQNDLTQFAEAFAEATDEEKKTTN